MFLERCRDRGEGTLLVIIERWVEKGTIIVTDCFRSYTHLNEHGYHHATVNHSENFVDPSTSAHTQRIEGMWHWVRAQALPRCGTRWIDLDLYLSAFLYRKLYGGGYVQFLQELASISKEDLLQEMRRIGTEQNREKPQLKRATSRKKRSNSKRPAKRQATPPPPEVQKVLKQTKITSPRKERHFRIMTGTEQKPDSRPSLKIRIQRQGKVAPKAKAASRNKRKTAIARELKDLLHDISSSPSSSSD